MKLKPFSYTELNIFKEKKKYLKKGNKIDTFKVLIEHVIPLEH